MGSGKKSGYVDISLISNIDQTPYGDNPTDIEYIENEIPKFDSSDNMWTITNFGISYPCVTMEYLPYPDDLGV